MNAPFTPSSRSVVEIACIVTEPFTCWAADVELLGSINLDVQSSALDLSLAITRCAITVDIGLIDVRIVTPFFVSFLYSLRHEILHPLVSLLRALVVDVLRNLQLDTCPTSLAMSNPRPELVLYPEAALAALRVAVLIRIERSSVNTTGYKFPSSHGYGYCRITLSHLHPVMIGLDRAPLRM